MWALGGGHGSGGRVAVVGSGPHGGTAVDKDSAMSPSALQA